MADLKTSTDVNDIFYDELSDAFGKLSYEYKRLKIFNILENDI